MGGGFTPWLPPRYWQRFKERHRRLFGTDSYRGRREEIIARAAIRHGRIRSARTLCQLHGLLKECYQDYVPTLVRRRNLVMEIIRGKV